MTSSVKSLSIDCDSLISVDTVSDSSLKIEAAPSSLLTETSHPGNRKYSRRDLDSCGLQAEATAYDIQ